MLNDPDYEDEYISEEESDNELEDELWKENIQVVDRKKSKKTINKTNTKLQLRKPFTYRTLTISFSFAD